MFRIELSEDCKQKLRHDPLVRSRNRKPLSGQLAPWWELRIGEHRAFYGVVGTTVQVLRIMRKGRKTTEEAT